MRTNYDFKSIIINQVNNFIEKFSFKLSKIDKINSEIRKIKLLKSRVEQYKKAKQLVKDYPKDPLANLKLTETMFRNFDLDWIDYANNYAKIRNAWLNENHLSDINMEFIGPETVIGSLGNHATIEGLINANKYNLRTKKNISLLLPKHLKLRNKTLFSYFEPHIKVIKDEKIIYSLTNLEKYFTLPMGFFIPFENKSVFHEFLPALIKQEQSGTSGYRPTFTLSDEDRQKGEAILEKMGIKKEWHVTLHIREPGYRGETKRNTNENFRNSNPENYLKSIKLITDKGGWVFRMGDPSMKKLPKMKNLIDYAHSSYKSDFMDVFLAATSKFCIATPSGFYTLADFFGVPILFTNVSNLSQYYSYKSEDILIPRLIKKEKKEYLNLNSLFSHPYLWFYSDKFFDEKKLSTEENSEEDIADATSEMLERTSGNKNSSQRNTALQENFKKIAEEKIYELTKENFPVFANIGAKFTEKYRKYLI